MSRKPEMATNLGYSLIGRAKLPKGLSFPIKRSTLDAFLRREASTSVTGVAFCGAEPRDAILSANYYGPQHRHSHHTLNLWIYAVPSAIRNSVEALIVTAAFPPLAEWLRSFDDVSLLRAKTDHSIRFVLEQPSSAERAATPLGSGHLRFIQQPGPGL